MSVEEKLQGFYGIGPKLAKELAKINGMGTTEASIKARLKKPDLFPKLPEATQADLTYKPNKHIPRAVLAKMDKQLHKDVRGIKFEIAGSYIRKKPFSHDVDLVVSTGRSNWETIWKKFTKQATIKILPPFAQGPGKLSVMMYPPGEKYPVKVDVFLTKPNEYLYALTYAIGSGMFNIRMRAVAKRRGYMLNQKGLWKKVGDTYQRVPVKDERDLFKILGITYKIPSQRTR